MEGRVVFPFITCQSLQVLLMFEIKSECLLPTNMLLEASPVDNDGPSPHEAVITLDTYYLTQPVAGSMCVMH